MPSQLILLIVVGGYVAFYYGDAELKAYCKGAVALVAALLAVRWVVRWVQEYARIGRHRTRVERLQAFANELEKGSLDARGFYSGGTTTVTGEVDGRSFEALLRIGRDPYVSYDLRVKGSAAELDAVRPGLVARLSRKPVPISWRSMPIAELRAPIEHLLLVRGLHRVSLHGGWLRAEAPLADEDLALDRLLDVCRTLSRVARACEPRPLREVT